MKKTFLHKAFAVAVAVALSLSATSCGDDDDNKDNEPADPAALKQVETSYEVEVSEDYLAFYDITVSHGFGGSGATTETMLFNSWSLDQEIPAVDLTGATLTCKVVATPKKNLPAIDPDKIYHLYYEYEFEVEGLRNDGRKTELKKSSFSNTATSVKGDRLKDVLDRGPRDIADFSYTL